MPVTAAPLLIAIYLRVSTEEQARKGYSLPEQREACRQKAQAIAANHREQTGTPAELHVAEFVDDFGGDIAERPVLEELREFVRTRRPAWLICMDPDRFSRSLKLQLIVADDVEAHQTRLAFVQQDYNPDDLMSRAFFQFRGLMSELDKAKILERTSRGRRGKVKAGKRPNGAAPFGYIHDKQTDELIIHPPEAQWVRTMFTWVADEHMGIYQVARRLNDLGVPTKRNGTKWYRSVVAGLLRNPAYRGEMRCNRKDFRGLAAVRRLPLGKRKPLTARIRPQAEWVTVPVPAIVSKDQWERAQANLRASATRGGRRDTGLLSMLLRCGECGGNMAYARHATGRHYLRCQRRYAHHYDFRAGTARCTNPHHRASAVEEFLWSELVAWLTDPQLLQMYLQQQRQGQGPAEMVCRLEQVERTLQERLEAEYRLQAVTVRKQAQGQLLDAVASPLLAESSRLADQVEAELQSTRHRLAAMRGELSLAANRAGQSALMAEQVTAEVSVTQRQLRSLGLERRRELVMMVIRHVSVDGGGQVAITLRDD